jgi:uncharacterized protein DUF1543
MHLFMIYIGGKHQNSLIELHDIRFVVAHSIEDTYETLRNSWWGVPKSLHLDCWGILKTVDGYDVQLADSPAADKNQLYFINLGGYDSSQFTELHKNFCVVATDEMEAKQKAKAQITQWESPHKDYIHAVDDVVNINKVISSSGMHIHLKLTNNASDFKFICKYVSIHL